MNRPREVSTSSTPTRWPAVLPSGKTRLPRASVQPHGPCSVAGEDGARYRSSSSSTRRPPGRPTYEPDEPGFLVAVLTGEADEGDCKIARSGAVRVRYARAAVRLPADRPAVRHQRCRE